jgi:hypothetical protein
MCFACRKTSPHYGDGEHLCSIGAMLHFGLWWPLDHKGENENSRPSPVQLGVPYASKKPTGFGAVSPNQHYSVADTA